MCFSLSVVPPAFSTWTILVEPFPGDLSTISTFRDARQYGVVQMVECSFVSDVFLDSRLYCGTLVSLFSREASNVVIALYAWID
jgi:hypothetical protein